MMMVCGNEQPGKTTLFFIGFQLEMNRIVYFWNEMDKNYSIDYVGTANLELIRKQYKEKWIKSRKLSLANNSNLKSIIIIITTDRNVNLFVFFRDKIRNEWENFRSQFCECKKIQFNDIVNWKKQQLRIHRMPSIILFGIRLLFNFIAWYREKIFRCAFTNIAIRYN